MDNIDFVTTQKTPKTTLKDLMHRYEESGCPVPDITIIEKWFIENNLEEEGLKLIAELARSKISRVEASLNSIRAWDLGLITSKGIQKQGYDEETSSKLETIERAGLLNKELDRLYLYKWAKETIPELDVPSTYYAPTLKYLSKYGIYFKNMPPEKVNKLSADYDDASVRS